jgi:hypothetical protein
LDAGRKHVTKRFNLTLTLGAAALLAACGQETRRVGEDRICVDRNNNRLDDAQCRRRAHGAVWAVRHRVGGDGAEKAGGAERGGFGASAHASGGE